MSALPRHVMQHLLYVQIQLVDSFVNVKKDLSLILVCINFHKIVFHTHSISNYKIFNFFLFISDCRPVGDLGLSSGIIPDTSIKVSGSEAGYGKNVRLLSTYIDIYLKKVFLHVFKIFIYA